MTEVKGGIRKMREAGLLPANPYMLKCRSVRKIEARETGLHHLFASSVIDGGFDESEMDECPLKDDKVRNRRVDVYLGCEESEDWTGLSNVLASVQLEEVPHDERGKPDVEKAVTGLRFPARVRPNPTHRRGPRNDVFPIIDNDWLTKVMEGTEEAAAPKARRSRRGKKAAASADTRRSRRRSR